VKLSKFSYRVFTDKKEIEVQGALRPCVRRNFLNFGNSSETGVSKHSEFTENSEFVLFRTFQKLQKRMLKSNFGKREKLVPTQKATRMFGLKFRMQGLRRPSIFADLPSAVLIISGFLIQCHSTAGTRPVPGLKLLLKLQILQNLTIIRCQFVH